MQILQKTNAYRHGHFVSQNNRHSSHYFKVPMTFHFSDNARILAVGLSRKFRMDTIIASHLPRIAVVSPSADGHSRRFQHPRRTQRRADILGDARKRSTTISAIH